jgi:hypothetical protein
LPRTLGIAEVDLHAGVDRELDVFGHLFALVPGDRSAQLRGQGQDPFGHRGADRLGAVTVREFEQDHVAAVTLDQRPDRGHLLSEDQVSFRMTRNRAISDLGGTFGDHHHVADPTLTNSTFGVGLGTAHRPPGPQARMQLFP